MVNLFVGGLVFGTGILIIIAGFGVKVKFKIPHVMEVSGAVGGILSIIGALGMIGVI